MSGKLFLNFNSFLTVLYSVISGKKTFFCLDVNYFLVLRILTFLELERNFTVSHFR